MKLHRFLSDHGDELLDACVQRMRRDIPDHRDEEVGEHLRGYLTEVIRVLRQSDGVGDETTSSERPPSEIAGERRRRGFRIEHLVSTYASLSVALGEVGGRYQQDFAAAEYGVFNQVVDRHVAEAIEKFAEEDRREHATRLRERIGCIAHELRNALQSVSMAFLMIERGQVGILGTTGDVARRNLRRMEDLVDRTLDVARAGAEGPVDVHDLALAPLLQEIETSAVLERGIRIRVDVDESLHAVADEHLLTSAIGNFLQNAIKFSHDAATVVLRARPEAEAVVIEVEDECGGLPEGKKEELFKPFVQASRDARGVGLGLTIAQDAVKALGGDLVVHDLPSKGCVFGVRLRGASPSEVA